jgi:hypothetical protein
MAKMCTTRVKSYAFRDDLFERLFLYFVECMTHWTVTDTIKLADTGELHTVFSRDKKCILWPAEYSMLSPQHQTAL